MLYGLECWAIKKCKEQKLHVSEMGMIRRAEGVAMTDKVRNEHIRATFKVVPIVEKVRENRLRWHRHTMKRDEDHITRRVMNKEKKEDIQDDH